MVIEKLNEIIKKHDLPVVIYKQSFISDTVKDVTVVLSDRLEALQRENEELKENPKYHIKDADILKQLTTANKRIKELEDLVHNINIDRDRVSEIMIKSLVDCEQIEDLRDEIDKLKTPIVFGPIKFVDGKNSLSDDDKKSISKMTQILIAKNEALQQPKEGN